MKIEIEMEDIKRPLDKILATQDYYNVKDIDTRKLLSWLNDFIPEEIEVIAEINKSIKESITYYLDQFLEDVRK